MTDDLFLFFVAAAFGVLLGASGVMLVMNLKM